MGKRTSVTALLKAEVKSVQTDLRRPSYPLATFSSAQAKDFPYPIDMSPLLAFPFGGLDEHGVLFNQRNGDFGAAYQPTSIAQYALAQWNAHLVSRNPAELESFLIQAHWLLEHETRFTNGTSVWIIPYPVPAYGANQPWLSALTQGNVLSVLTRAYTVTGQEAYLDCARRCVRAFQFDILDGGVASPVANGGIFFEEVATYPAGRILNGYILSVLGLYDYLHVAKDPEIQRLTEWSVETLHELLPGYDLGYWSSYDLIYNRPASRFYHLLHVSLLRALAQRTGCQHCRDLADRWADYDRPPFARLRYFARSRSRRYASKLARAKTSLERQGTNPTIRTLAGITGAPIAGGVYAGESSASQVTPDDWRDDWQSAQRQCAARRERLGLRRDALVVVVACDLLGEKDLSLALEAVGQARSSIAPEVAARLQMVFAAKRRLSNAEERNIRMRIPDHELLLATKAAAEAVGDYLGCADIFLSTGYSGPDFLRTASDAMGAGCAVVATSSTIGSRMLLDAGRGIAIPSGSVNALGAALTYLLADDEARARMGASAWKYSADQRTAEAARRARLRSEGWIPNVDAWIQK